MMNAFGDDSGEKRVLQQRSPGENPNLVRTAILLGGFALFSRVLGLARDMGMAWILGGGAAADALVAAMRLPHALRRMLGEGSFSMTLTASLVHLAHFDGARISCATGISGTGHGNMCMLASALALRLSFILGALTLVGMATAPLVLDLLAPGFKGAERTETIFLLRLCLPYVLAAGMAALAMAFLHSMGIFWLPALSPALFNVVMLCFVATAAFSGMQPALILAVGMLCAGVTQWLIQWLAVRRLLSSGPGTDNSAKRLQHKSVDQAFGKRDAALVAWRCLGRLPTGMLGAAAPQLAMLVAMALASGLGRGQVAALYYAERLLELPIGLVGVCLGMASLPTLSRLAGERNFAQLEQQLATALRLTMLLSLPAVAGLWIVGPRLVEGLLRHGAFGEQATRETALALWAYLPGLPAVALSRSLLAACNALGETRSTALSTVLAVGATLAVGSTLVHNFSDSVGGMAPALAVSLGLWLQCGLLLRVLDRALQRARGGRGCPRAYLPGLATLLRQIAAAAATAFAACLLQQELRDAGLWTGLVFSILGGAMACAACLLVLRDKDALALARGLIRCLRGNV